MILRPLLERSATLAVLFCSAVAIPLSAQRNHKDYDDVNPWLGFEQRDTGPDSSAVAGFLAALAASRPFVCQIAADNLGNNWRQSNGGYRGGMLEGEAAQEAAREALSHRVSDARALARLSDALGDQNLCVRRAAAHLLGQSREPEASRLLRTGLRAGEARVREAAVLGLACADDPASFGELSRALHDKEPAVVRMAAYALGQLEDARAVKPLGAPPRLIAALGDRDPELRIIAAASLSEIGDSAAVPALANAYRSDDPRLRYAVVKALADTDDRRGNATLTMARQDSDRIVRHAAAEALKDQTMTTESSD